MKYIILFFLVWLYKQEISETRGVFTFCKVLFHVSFGMVILSQQLQGASASRERFKSHLLM